MMMIADFNFDGFSVDMTRSMVAMRDVSLLLTVRRLCYWFIIHDPGLASYFWFPSTYYRREPLSINGTIFACLMLSLSPN